jgi:MFS transporter, DHA2 family, multidrug resistance protein
MLERREQFHTLRLNEKLDPLNPALTQWFEQAQAYYFQQTGDMPTSRAMAIEALQNLRNQQALALAYFDVFWISAALSAALVFLVLLMRPSMAEKGAHIAAE